MLDISKQFANTCPPEWIEKHPGAFDNHPNDLSKIDVQPLLKALGYTCFVGSAQGKDGPRWQTGSLTAMKKDLSLLPAWLDKTKSLPEAEITRKGSTNSTYIVYKWGTIFFTSLAGTEKPVEPAKMTYTLTLVPAADAKVGVKKVMLLACLVSNQNHIKKTTLEVKSITIGEKDYPFTTPSQFVAAYRCTALGRGYQVPVQPGVPIKFNLVGDPDLNNGSIGTWLALEE